MPKVSLNVVSAETSYLSLCIGAVSCPAAADGERALKRFCAGVRVRDLPWSLNTPELRDFTSQGAPPGLSSAVQARLTRRKGESAMAQGMNPATPHHLP